MTPTGPGRGAEREPTADELLAMAYVDGELDLAARAAFDARLVHEPALAREVSALRALEVLARRAAPPEPQDHEWARIARSPLQRALLPLAWAAIALSAVGLAGWALWAECTCGLALLPKLCVLGLELGLLALLALHAKNRLRTLPYDPYTKVKR
jgi:hypothetical protein